MSIFSHPHNDGHEKVAFYNDKTSGLKAIVAIHNTNLGQSLGGLRMYPYASDEAALAGVLQLSKGMTYKSALAGLPLGGGKAVIWGNPAKDKTDALFEAMGQFVDTMSGDYIVAQDSGVTVDDLQVVGSKTAHITGISKRIDDNGVELNGDPSPSTAYGVFIGVKAAVKHKLQRDNLKGLRVAIQGVGSVGYRLAEYLHKEGAELWVSDVNAASVQLAVDNLGAKAVNGDDIFSLDVDVLAPCALGGAINGETIKLLKTSIIAGGANNQLLLPEFGDILHKQGVLYAPDFVINAGGIIDCYYLTTHKPYSDMRKHVAEIGNTLSEIFTLSDQSDEATSVIANRMAEQGFMRTS